MLVKIDTFIQRFFTLFAHWFERKTGKTNFYLAWCAFGCALSFYIVHMGYKLTILRQFVLFDLILVLSYPLSVLILGDLLLETQKEGERALSRPTIVSSVDLFYACLLVVRLILSALLLIISVLSLLVINQLITLVLNALFLFATWCGFYFFAVQRPPLEFMREPKEEAK